MARLKKGSAAAKAWGAKMRKLRGGSKKTSTNPYSRKRTNKKMAKRKGTYRRSRSSGSSVKPAQILIGGGLYGAVRRYIDGWVKPITSKIPLGTIADEVALFTAAYFLNKNVKDKTAKQVAQAGMVVEAARIGEALSDGSAFAGMGSSSNGAAVSQFSTLG